MSSDIRTLVLTRKFPSRTWSGSSMRNRQNIDALQRLGPTGIFHVETLGYSTLHPPNGVAYCTSHGEGYSVTRMGRLVAGMLRRRGIPIADYYFSDAIDQKLRGVLESFQPDIVVFEEAWLFRYLPTVRASGAAVVLDMHNVEQPVYRDVLATAPMRAWRSRIEARLLHRTSVEMERLFLHAVDQIWTCSDDDAALTRTLYGAELPIRVIPNGIDVPFYAPIRGETNTPLPASHHQDPILLFCGNFTYYPNVDAALELINEVLPLVQRTHPRARAVVVGRNPPAVLRSAAQRQRNVALASDVDDVRPYLAAASVVVVPLRHGSGTRFKILEGFAARRPVVCTPKAAEGLAAKHGDTLLLGEDAAAMASEIARVIHDPALREELTSAGYALVEREYSWRAAHERIADALQTLELVRRDAALV